MTTIDRRPLVVIAGGGIAALEAVLALERFAGSRVRLALLTPARELVYRPLLVAEPFGHGPAPRVALEALLRDREVDHVHDRLVEVDVADRLARMGGGDRLPYDALLVATGARTVDAVPGATHFDGPAGVAAMRTLLDELDRAAVRRVAFAVPPGCGWTLPLYELALLTAAHLFERRRPGVELRVVTAEPAPLAAFGGPAAHRVASLLARQGIELQTDARVDAIDADRVVALPRPVGPRIAGLPHDDDGFVPTDKLGRVRGAEHVFAAGDVTNAPIKQGGLATQQADAAAATIAAWAGAPVRPEPFRPVLRGMLLGAESPVFMRHERDRRHDERSHAASAPLWWPPGKVAGRFLGPQLAAHGTD